MLGFLRSLVGNKGNSGEKKKMKPALGFDTLEARDTPAVQAFFTNGVLTVLGDAAANNINVSADAAGNLQVTNGTNLVAIQSSSGAATLSNTNLITVAGANGNDNLRIDASIGTIQSILSGDNGNDTLDLKHRGNSTLLGGNGNDLLVSGFGNDVMLGGDGNDLLRWDPGTINDTMEGGAGNDTVLVIGNDTFMGQPAGDQFQLTANGNRVRFDRLNLVPFNLDIGTTENIVLQPGAGDDVVIIKDLTGVSNLRNVQVDGGDGNDRIDASQQANARINLQLNGNGGNDVVIGGAGNDSITGGEGNDSLTGLGGSDLVQGGNGNDLLVGDRFDFLAGQRGADVFAFVGGRPSTAALPLFTDFSAAQGDRLF